MNFDTCCWALITVTAKLNSVLLELVQLLSARLWVFDQMAVLA